MLVRELIAMLQGFDPHARVLVEYDTHFFDVKAVQPQVILTEGSSWADYPGEGDPELEVNMDSPREAAVAIWGTKP